MRSLLRFSLLLSLSVVDVSEKMVKVQIKIHKEPPDHKMVIKVGLCTSMTCYTLDGDAHSTQSIPGPRSTPITLYPSALSTRLSTLPTPQHPRAHPPPTPSAPTAHSQHDQHILSTLSTVHAHNVARKFRTVHRSAPQ